MRPLKDLAVLNNRLDAISYLCQPRHAEVLKSLQSYVKNIKNVAVSVKNFQSAEEGLAMRLKYTVIKVSLPPLKGNMF
jgi:hypothetical protein